MAGRNKQPVDVLTARGKSHLTKAEKERRKATESVVPVALRGVSPPGYLDKWPEIRREFVRYAEMLSATRCRLPRAIRRIRIALRTLHLRLDG